MTIPGGPANWLIIRWGLPLALTFLAGRRFFPLWAVLHHRGRTSGRLLAVPVAVLAAPDVFVIPLLFGPRTNWVRNVLAADGCVLRWRGVEHSLTGPELIGPARARPYFGSVAWRCSEMIVKPEGFLLLHRADSVTDPF